MSRGLPKTMRAAAIDQFGGVETLHVESVDVPEPGPDEVLIHVETAGVGEWDPFEREGGFAKMMGSSPKFPYVLGTEGAGTVAAVGKRVRRFKKGDRVYAMSLASSRGFYAEYAAVKVGQASKVPEKLSIDQAGVMAVDAITGLRGLDALGLRAGASVLIFGASGGIGHLALQLAKRMGARVLAVASGEDGVALARHLGADAVVDGHKDDVGAAARNFAPDGIDAVLLTAGGEGAQKAADAVHEGGRIAYPHGVEPEPKARPDVKVVAYDGDPDPEIIQTLNRLIESGPFEVHVAQVFPLDQAPEAHRALERHHLGKYALRTTAA
jgi:NADPH:quinone reductase-like Zn-dependent oxidoreductase